MLAWNPGLSVTHEKALKLIHPDDKAMFRTFMSDIIGNKGQASSNTDRVA
jgi:hypothetical protein